MDWTPEDETAIRRYLLKQVGEEEEQMIEERMLRDNDYAELVELIEEEMIDDYARTGGNVKELARFVQGASKTRRNKLLIAQNAVVVATKHVSSASVEEKKSVWHLLFVPLWKPLAFATIVATLAVSGYWQATQYRRDIGNSIVALNQAYSTERPLRGRITELEYAPFSVRLGDSDRPIDATALDRARRLSQDAVHNSRDAEARHALGRVYLAEKRFDAAITELEAALNSKPNDPGLHNDMGVALIEKASAEQHSAALSPSEVSKALDHFNQALQTETGFVDALFNRALLFRATRQWQLAKQDFRSYLQQDRSSRWAGDAQDYLEEIERLELTNR